MEGDPNVGWDERQMFLKTVKDITSSRGKDIFLGLKERGTSGYR